jgi:hypothetical protein
MNKFFGIFLAVLLVCGVAFAASIPGTEDATDGPAVWTIPVYNNSSGTLDVGDVVVWDIANSTGDNDNYVTTTTTADTHIVAGVVYPSDIADGAVGTIVIRGVVQVDVVQGNLQTAGGLACTGTTAGSAGSCADDNAAFGIVTQGSSGGTSALVFVK